MEEEKKIKGKTNYTKLIIGIGVVFCVALITLFLISPYLKPKPTSFATYPIIQIQKNLFGFNCTIRRGDITKLDCEKFWYGDICKEVGMCE